MKCNSDFILLEMALKFGWLSANRELCRPQDLFGRTLVGPVDNRLAPADRLGDWFRAVVVGTVVAAVGALEDFVSIADDRRSRKRGDDVEDKLATVSLLKLLLSA